MSTPGEKIRQYQAIMLGFEGGRAGGYRAKEVAADSAEARSTKIGLSLWEKVFWAVNTEVIDAVREDRDPQIVMVGGRQVDSVRGTSIPFAEIPVQLPAGTVPPIPRVDPAQEMQRLVSELAFARSQRDALLEAARSFVRPTAGVANPPSELAFEALRKAFVMAGGVP